MRRFASLEDKCSDLTSNVELLNNELERYKALETMNESNNIAAYTNNETRTQNEESKRRFERLLATTKAEKNSLEQKLHTWKSKADNLKQANDQAEDKINKLVNDLQRAESKVNAANIELKSTMAAMESNAQGNFVRKELSRIRKENEILHQKLQEANEKILIIETQKSELEQKNQKQRMKISSTSKHMMDQVDHVRSQIPLVSGGVGKDNSGGPHGGSHLHHHNLLKIKIAEQEIERQRKKVKALEEQLSSLENAHVTRIQDILNERRQEKDKEHRRHRVALERNSESLAAREQIYKARIRGLEEQVETLRDQLAKEFQRRHIFIARESGINQDISELRANLDESLRNVGVGSVRYTSSEELGKTLDRESNKLHQIGQKFVNMSSSTGIFEDAKNQLNQEQSLQRGNVSPTNVKRTLSFENIIT